MTAPTTPPTFNKRPWVAAGVALTTASMVAAAPVAVREAPQFNFAELEVQLTGLVDETANNLTNLVDYFAGTGPAFLSGVGAPFPVLQQVLANGIDNLGTILSNPGDIGTVFESMFENLQAGLAAPFGFFADSVATGGPLTFIPEFLDSLVAAFLGVDDLSRASLFTAVEGLLTGNDLSALLDFTASPVSGLMLGAVGPILGPLVALGNGLETAFGGDPAALLGLPEAMLNAFLNGGETLSVLPLLDLIGIPDTIGIDGLATIGIDEAGLELGGVLGGPGSLFNALTAVISGNALGLIDFGGGLEGAGAGPIGSLLSIPNSIAAAIGTGGIDGLDQGLLSTIASSFDLTDVVNGLGDVSTFLSTNILDPLSDALMFLPNELASLLTDSGLGVDLGIDALAQMFVNIPQLLLTMMI